MLKDTVVEKFISAECNLSIKVISRHSVARNQSAKIKERREWDETWSKTNMDYTKNYIFIDESACDSNMKPPIARSARGTLAIVTSPSARAISHTILGAISVCGVVNMEIRVPLTPKIIKVVGAQKRKATAMKAKTPGTNAGHFTNSIKKTMDEMDKCPQFKEYYTIMDNSPIHGKNGDLNQLIENRGYKCVYLLPYSPELKTRIAEACSQVPRNYLHSMYCKAFS